jgi:hypothetical protein
MKTVIAAALGECVHVAGISNFLHLAGPLAGVPSFSGRLYLSKRFLKLPGKNADMVGVSYRLTADTGERLLGEFAEAASDLHEAGVRFALAVHHP